MKQLALDIKHHTPRTNATHLIIKFNQTLAPQHNTQRVLKPLSTEELAFLIYNLGKICEQSSVKIQAYSLSQIILELHYSKNITPKMIATALHGLGVIAEKKKLNGAINVSTVQPLMQRLNTTSNTQAIANIILAFGRLAKAGQLHGNINTSSITAQLNLLKNPNEQEIANTIYGLGLLAKAAQLHGNIEASSLTTIIDLLQNPTAQDIANTIYGLGLLAQAGQLYGNIKARSLTTLLDLLNNPTEQTIANTIYGLGLLAQARQLNGNIEARSLTNMFNLLQNPTAQNIANIIYGLGLLAKAKQLHSSIEASTITILLNLLKNPRQQDIINTIFGLSLLAKTGQLNGNIEAHRLTTLISLLQNPTEQEIANTIYGLGELAHANQLQNKANLSVASIMAKQNIQQCQNIELRQTLQGLSALDYQHDTQLNTLFHATLNVAYMHPSDAIRLLGFYAKLATHNPTLDITIFEQLLENITVSYAQCSPKNRQTLDQTLVLLTPAQKTTLSAQLGLTPPPIASSVTPVIHLRHTTTALPQQSPEWIRACQNRLFKAIADNRLEELEKLLNILIFTPTASTTPNNPRRNAFFPEGQREQQTSNTPQQKITFDAKKTADAMVTSFLQKIPAQALKTLITRSAHDYFHRLLFACSKHQQYQFAIQHDLNPIMFYLSIRQLEHMINAFIQLGFYQDHKATLALVEALFLRKQIDQDNKEYLTTLQSKLLNRAVEFHQQQHRHVTPILKKQRELIQSQNEMLLDEDEFITQEPALTRQALTDKHQQTIEQPVHVPEHHVHTHKRAREVAPTTSASTRTAERPFQEDVLVLSNGNINTRAYYSSEHIQRLLEMKLQDRANIQLLAPLDYQQAPPKINMQRHLLEFLGNNPIEDNAQLLLPICINHHWVGVKITVQQNVVHIAYYDSLRNSTSKPLVLDVIKEVAEDIYDTDNITCEDKTYYFQDDVYSCGPLLIENMAKDVLNTIGKKHSPLVFRQKHAEMLGIQYNHSSQDDAHIDKRPKNTSDDRTFAPSSYRG